MHNLLNSLMHRHLDDLLYMLDLRHMNMNNLFFVHNNGDMPNDFVRLDGAWDMYVLVYDVNLWHFHDSFHVLDLRDMNMNDLLFNNRDVDMPDDFVRLNGPWNMYVLVDNRVVWNFYDSLNMLDLRHLNMNDLLLMDNHGDVNDVLTRSTWAVDDMMCWHRMVLDLIFWLCHHSHGWRSSIGTASSHVYCGRCMNRWWQ